MKILFGSVIVVLLLAAYVFCVGVGVNVVRCAAEGGSCTEWPAARFTEGLAHTMTLVGGLVSSLVVAELAITQPGAAPVARALDADATAISKRF